MIQNQISFILLVVISISLGAISVVADEKKKETSKLLSMDILAGRHLFTLKQCSDCHTKGEKDYTPILKNMDEKYIINHAIALKLPLVLGQSKSKRKKKKILKQEAQALADYLNNRKDADLTAENLVMGSVLMLQKQCRNCHLINEKGRESGPDLAGIGERHDKKWIIKHFKNPQAFVKDSVMPKFESLSKKELEAMTDYLLKLK